MLFQTYEFLVLLLLVVAGLGLLARASHQQWLLVAASYLFYGWWDVRFLMLLLASSLVDYASGLGIAGVGLTWSKRYRLSGIGVLGACIFLGVNWPALQRGDAWPSLATLFAPTWPMAREALVVCVAASLLGPLVFEAYSKLPEATRRKAFLVTSLAANLGMLGFFKYFNFFRDNLVGVGRLVGSEWTPAALSVALPVGISFYTFQTMSYSIDVYRRQIEPERSFLRFALFVSYFPQLVAGPILRPQQFLPALDRAWTLHAAHIRSGFHLIIVGMFKKVLIADWVAKPVNVIFSDPIGQPSLVIWLGTMLFAVQIYCDFSGYTDIARGVSRMFGIEIPLNFNFPYFATSIVDFWRRWHISLSTWLRDYLYIPLGGNRVRVGRMYMNLLTTMALGGLWHGASWNFVLWGVYQGALLCVNRIASGWIDRSPRLFALVRAAPMQVILWGVTMYFVLLGWLIFRVTNLPDLWYAMQKFVLFDGRLSASGLGLGEGSPFVALAAFCLFAVLHAFSFFRKRWVDVLDGLPPLALPIVYFLLGMLFFFAWPSYNAPFIYFQF